MKTNVTNMQSSKGNNIPNQFVITTDNGVYFQSYQSIIARIFNGLVELDSKYWNYSKTTGKYRNIFLNENRKETEAKIASGVYKMVDLNS